MASKETFKCPFCNSSYSRKFNLERHLSNTHPNTKETLIATKQDPLQELILKLFLHSTFDTINLDENSIHFLTAIYLVSSLPKYSFDVLWHLLTQLHNTKYHLLFELFTTKNIHKTMNLFPENDEIKMPMEYRTALLSISSFIIENNITKFTKYTDILSIMVTSDKLVVDLN